MGNRHSANHIAEDHTHTDITCNTEEPQQKYRLGTFTSGQLFLKAILHNKTSFPTEQTPQLPKFHQEFRRDHGETEDSLKFHQDQQKIKETPVFRLQKKIIDLNCENTNIIIIYFKNDHNNCIALFFSKNETMTENVIKIDSFNEQIMFENMKYLFLENSVLINIISYNFTQGNNEKLLKNICHRVIASQWLCSKFCDKTAYFRHTCTSRASISNYIKFKYPCQFLKTYKTGQQHMCICDSQDTCGLSMLTISSITRNNDTDKNIHTCLQQSLTNISPYKNLHINQRLKNIGIYKNLHTQHLHIQRKLLSAIDKMQENNGTEGNKSRTQEERRFGYGEDFNYTKFMEVVEYLNRRRSKDPLWAICCIMGLIAVLVWAMWCCGLRKIDTKKYINVNIDEHFHYVSVRDILRSKKKYLSKKILQFKRRHKHRKRKYRRLKDPEKIERDIVSDNSEEERLIYSANDF